MPGWTLTATFASALDDDTIARVRAELGADPIRLTRLASSGRPEEL